MAYKLSETKIEESHLLHRIDGEAAERHGAIGYMRADFGGSGREFWSTWFDSLAHLKTAAFKKEFEEIINFLRDDGQKSPLASRTNLETFCQTNTAVSDYTLRTQDYSYYFRFRPMRAHYDVYCYAYDNRYLLPELAGQHKLPETCASILPSTGEIILIDCGESGYRSSELSTSDPVKNRRLADAANAGYNVTRAQEEAMQAGSMFGWGVAAAKPWHYDQNGNPRLPAKQKDRESR